MWRFAVSPSTVSKAWRRYQETGIYTRRAGSVHVPSAVRYQDDINRATVRNDAGAVDPGFLLVQDKTRPHVARVCTQFPWWQRPWCHRLGLSFPWHKSTWAPMVRYLWRIQRLTVPFSKSSAACPDLVTQARGCTHYWVTLWVALMKFTQVLSDCHYNYLPWFSVWLWIQPLVGWWFWFALTVVTSFCWV